MSDFGAGFKKAREKLGVSLDKIADETRISTRFLSAIEKEDFHLLPGGIFNKGFIRAYAERVGLDPDQAIADYERLVRVVEPEAQPTQAEPAPQKSSGRHLYPVAIGALVLVVVLFYIFTRDSATNSVTASEPIAEEAAAPPPALESTPPATAEVPNATPSATQEAIPPATPVPAVPAPRATPPTTAGGSAMLVEMTAGEVTWIRVDADGVVSEAILEPGQMREFTGRSSITVTIGNAGGFMLKVNGREVPRLGGSGRVREFIITPENAANITG